jgi:hypothetical protein
LFSPAFRGDFQSGTIAKSLKNDNPILPDHSLLYSSGISFSRKQAMLYFMPIRITDT